MNRLSPLACVALALFASFVSADELPKPLLTGLAKPESVTVGLNGVVYVTQIGDFDKDGDGSVVAVKDGKAVPFCEGLDDPKGIVAYTEFLFVADKNKVVRIDRNGKATDFAAAKAFPKKPQFLNDIAVDIETGTLFVSDSGDLKGDGGTIYRISNKGVVDLVIDSKDWPELKVPNGLLLDGQSNLLVIDFGNGTLYRLKLADKSREKIADGFGGSDGLAWDPNGRLFISDWKNGKVWVIPRPGDKPVLLVEGLKSAADLCVNRAGTEILVPDMLAGTLTALPNSIPGAGLDRTPMPLKPAVAFPKLKWSGWSDDDSGAVPVLRPIVLTHANDQSGRTFVATQRGVIHVFPKQQTAEKTKVFLDLSDRVRYTDKQNEEGFLGFAFHPNYKKTGEFYAFYTLKDAKHPLTNVVSRFRVSKDDPDQADPRSEEELLRIERPFWNHDGGTIAFGPDGYLYIALGDGGAANDPYENGQNLGTLLGKILRIDVDHKGKGTPYAIPKDNPFVGKKGSRPEIWCYGLRNVWRFSFDRKTGTCWGADVGQNLWEEIDLFTAGGNYGWNLREGLHPFGAKGVGVRKDLIDPIWEYHHDIGKSITGGVVYRGKRLPELEGSYLYADYVSGIVWALKYDEKEKRVVSNRAMVGRNLPALSFGEDEDGEAYILVASPTGQGIFHLVPAE